MYGVYCILNNVWLQLSAYRNLMSIASFFFSQYYLLFLKKKINNNEQTENMKIFFYIFTFKEKDSNDFKISDIKRKDNFEFGIFSYRETILEF